MICGVADALLFAISRATCVRRRLGTPPDCSVPFPCRDLQDEVDADILVLSKRTSECDFALMPQSRRACDCTVQYAARTSWWSRRSVRPRRASHAAPSSLTAHSDIKVMLGVQVAAKNATAYTADLAAAKTMLQSEYKDLIDGVVVGMEQLKGPR